MAVLLCVVLSLASSQLEQGLGDLFAYIALLLIGVVLALVLWRRFRDRTTPEQDHPDNKIVLDRSPWFWLCLALTVVVFWWVYLTQMFVNEDPNPEAMECSLAIGFLEKARAAHRPADVFWQEDPLMAHVREQDPFYTKGPLDRFKYQWTSQAHSFCCIWHLPFVKALGLNRKVIVWYSTFFAIIAWLGTGLLAWRMFGRWCGVLAAALMATSLGWLIHVRVGYQQVTPSVALMVLLALCLHRYWCCRSRWMLVLSGGLLGLMYLIGWIAIVFGVLLTVAVLVFAGVRRPGRTLLHGLCVAGCAVLAAVVFAWLYAWRYDFPASKIHESVREIMFGRFKEGEPGLLKLSTGGRIAYVTKCLFWDSRTLDGHVDKYLEGHPAVPWIVTVFLVVGLLGAIRRGDIADQLLLFWMLAVFGVLGLVFIYGHRYAMVVLPAMSILAAGGVLAAGDGLRKPFPLLYGIVVGALLLATAWNVHGAYYGQYLQHKEATSEDRLRGHHRFAVWLERTGTPDDTLVVMSDAVMFPSTVFLFNTYGKNYRWVYWSRFFQTGSTADQVRAWEQQLPARFRRIVYAFSPSLLGDPQRGQFFNDPRPFLAAHPELKPSWTYSYAGRPPLILAFEVRR